jgi:hypothetical protein
VQDELFRAMNPSPENAATLFGQKRVPHSGKKMVVLLLISAIPKEEGERK